MNSHPMPEDDNLRPEYDFSDGIRGKHHAEYHGAETDAELLEDIEELAAIAKKRNEPTISHEELLAGLKRGGLFS